MSILTFLLISVVIAFSKKQELVKSLGILAFIIGLLSALLGLYSAFNVIEQVGNVAPAILAGGIKIALLTTVGGLIVAVILQLFYNYLVSKIDSLVNTMEDASISLVDILVRNKLSK